MSKKFQVVGIGNAMVDVLAHVDEGFLAQHGVEKGIMQLIDTARAAELYGYLENTEEVGGGSAANTIAGIAALGGSTAYVGKVKDDPLGEVFARDLRAIGAVYETPLAPADHADKTGLCTVLVTPDSERSLNTYLGVSEHLGPDDIDEAMMGDADWIYLEGYRFDGPASHAAFAKAIKACKGAGGRVSITLSDPFCVERHRDAFAKMIAEDVDLLFANEHEMKSLYQEDDLDKAMARAADECDLVACTVGAQGAWVLGEGRKIMVPAAATKVVDVTGAGDMFAAGFLAGLSAGKDLPDCGQMGCIAAGEIISHIGARPEADLKELMAKAGL